LKVVTILGTRPEIIRLSRIIPLLDAHCEHLLVHTGQNFDDRLSGLFFRELGVREPDLHMGVRGNSFGEQAGEILARSEALLGECRPDGLIVLGDTNSGLSAIVACRMGIPVYHLEAGNRCYDYRVPEESNRVIIDNMSTVLMPYTQRSRENLLREGFQGESIYVTGNPIFEVLECYSDRIAASCALQELGVEERKYFLVSMHRAENVDVKARLQAVLRALGVLHERYGLPVVLSVHPRTRARISEFAIDTKCKGLLFMEPFGFFDFVRLERSALCLLSDSGTVQEEACIFRVPNVTIRDVTERPETIECGSNVLAGCDTDKILRLVELVTSRPCDWEPPTEYLAREVSSTVARIVLGYRTAALCR